MFIGSIAFCGFMSVLFKEKQCKEYMVWMPFAVFGMLIPLAQLVIIWDKTRPDVERGRSFGGSSGLMVARNPAGGEPAPSPVASRVVTGVAEVYDSSFTTASTGSTPSGSGSEPLREPREFQITDEELEKLIGENNEPFG